jgi:hypothetical protein
MSEKNNLLTASRMGTYLRCPRAHYWACEVGLRPTKVGLALRLGTAWHAGMEARWKGKNYDDALKAALGTSEELDELTCSTVAALLAGYYWYYGKRETFGKLLPELEFNYQLPGSETFSAAGKVDGLGQLTDERTALIESKTTSDSLAPESDYWLRLRFNPQVFQYIDAARNGGWDISEVIYDVTRKPTIRPKMINDLDKDGLKIVLDAQGKRVFLANGKPRLGGDTAKGYYIKEHRETPEEFGARLLADIQSRPEHYFARREVPILDDEISAFEAQRLTIANTIEYHREVEASLAKPEDAWPRNVDVRNCKFCSFSSFCLQNLSVDRNSPPSGFIIAGFNPELSDMSVNEEEQPTE